MAKERDKDDEVVEMLDLPKEKGPVAAYCQCSPGCQRYLWSGGLALRTRSGKILNIGHALQGRFIGRDELDELHRKTFPQYFKPDPEPEPEPPPPETELEPEPEPEPQDPEPEPEVETDTSTPSSGTIKESKPRAKRTNVLRFFTPEGEEDNEMREILDLLRDD